MPRAWKFPAWSIGPLARHAFGCAAACGPKGGLRALETRALRNARLYRATSVLFVPAVVKKDVAYADAYQRSQAEIRKVLPLVKELNVKIALENVWNNFLLSTLETARYVDEFNLRRWWCISTSEMSCRWLAGHWIRTLGKRIYKLDIGIQPQEERQGRLV